MRANRSLTVSALVLTLATTGFTFAAEAPPSSSYRAEIEQWRQQRDKSLRSDSGWLTLAGLFWLGEGDNTFGSAADNALVFPTPAPAKLGTLHRQGKVITLRATPGAGLEVDGKAVTELALASDAEGEPTLVTVGSLSFFVVERGERIGIRLKDKLSPLLHSFAGIESFPLDPSWRIEARFEPYDPPKPIKIPDILGDTSETACPGALVLERGGVTYRLEPTGEPGEPLFLVFGDATNSHETYGGGRFLSVPAPGPDGKVIVDFNRAYNPPCVFTPYATCPLPPKQNKLALRIEAGEKMFHSPAAGH